MGTLEVLQGICGHDKHKFYSQGVENKYSYRVVPNEKFSAFQAPVTLKHSAHKIKILPLCSFQIDIFNTL